MVIKHSASSKSRERPGLMKEYFFFALSDEGYARGLHVSQAHI